MKRISRLSLLLGLVAAVSGIRASQSDAPARIVTEVTSEKPPLAPDEDRMGTFHRIFRDSSTGLYWTNVIDDSLTQAEGERDCAWINGGTAGNGWRMPTKDELKQVAKNGIGDHSKAIGDNGSSVWSGTVSERDPVMGWVVTLRKSGELPAGAATDHALRVSQRPVMCVRGEEPRKTEPSRPDSI